MKIITFYLPQYHECEENNRWWGKGFTDWVAVKNAKPLFDGHYQPNVPQNNYYYDLMNKETLQWQANLMHKYDIYGMCFYHYWFKDGRTILEKPAENLLKYKDIDMPFCFSWANETWARTWSRLRFYSNVWSSEQEPNKESDDDGILLEQKYGDEELWIKHFEYLLPFFKDQRYIKMENKPMILIHKAAEIPCLANMLETWRNLSKENGFDGLYIMGNNPAEDQEFLLDKMYIMEPRSSLNSFDLGAARPQRIDYEDVWKGVIEDAIEHKDAVVGGFVGYDCTPRRGCDGLVIENKSVSVFEKYMQQLISINRFNGNNFLFVNAWNEWGEGMYLEPDEKDGYAFLEALKRTNNSDMKYPIDSKKWKRLEKNNTRASSIADSRLALLKREIHIKDVLDQWLELLERGKSIASFLIERNIYDIGIYGYGILGKHLYRELENSEIKITFIVDRNQNLSIDTALYGIEDEWPVTSAIIVTAINDYGVLFEKIKEKNKNYKTFSIEHIINEC